MDKYLKVLKNKRFSALLIGQAISAIGSQISFVALISFIVQLTNKASNVSLLFMFLTIPWVIFGPYLGVLVDKWNKKCILITSDIARGILSLLFIFFLNNVIVIYILMFFIIIFFVFFNPALTVSIKRIVKADDLMTANALHAFINAACGIIGPVLGGLLIAFCGIKNAFIIDGISFMFSAFMIMFIAIPEMNNFEEEKENEGKFINHFKEGIAYINQNIKIKFVIIFFAIASLFLAAIPILGIIIIYNILKYSPSQYGMLLSVYSAGMIVGSLFIGKYGAKFNEYSIMVVGVGLYGLTYVGFALGKLFILSCLFFFASGFFNICISIAYNTYLQKSVDDDKQGRVFSIDMAISNFVSLLAMSSVGFIADYIGSLNTVIICCGSLIALSLIVINMKIYKETIINHAST